LVKRGEIVGPVKETLIAGNVFDLLHRIVGMGSRVKRTMATQAPAVLVDGVVVTTG
jgi:PmbA protein